MKKLRTFLPLVLVLAVVGGILLLVFKSLRIAVDSNFFMALSTLLVGFGAIYLYISQRIDSKRDAARIIVQEIRRAEDIIRGYKDAGNFQFTKRIIANNSWGKNIHFFVGDLDPDELDKISNLYSTGEFLDTVISRIFDWKFDYESRKFYEEVPMQRVVAPVPPPEVSLDTPPTASVQMAGGIEMTMPKPQSAFWSGILLSIVAIYEPIYHTPIIEELKRIAGIYKK